MKKLLFCAAAALGAALALPGAANAQVYVGAGYSHLDADGAGDLGALTGRLGSRFNRFFALEGEAGLGVDDDGPVELNHTAGVFALGILPLSQRFDLHGRIGYQNTEFDAPGGDADSDGLAYGIGGAFNLSERFAVRADVTRLEGDVDADTVSLGAVVRF